MTELQTVRPWLIWGYDFSAGRGATVCESAEEIGRPVPADGFRWLHLNLADQRTFNWLDQSRGLPGAARDLLRSTDRHARALIVEGAICGVLPDFERDLESTAFAQTGTLCFVLTETLMITARIHPVCAADVIHQRICTGLVPTDGTAALELLIVSLAAVGSDVAAKLTLTVQEAEDALLNDDRSPKVRELVMIRRRAVQLHRHLYGVRSVLTRLEGEVDMPEVYGPALSRLIQRVASLDGDVGLLQSNLRQLRDELDVQTANRVNQNLYVLSVLSALLLPATFVTGFFGMNTGGMLWLNDSAGTVKATLVAAAVALAVLFWLRAKGFFRI